MEHTAISRVLKSLFNIFTEKQKSKIIRQKLDELMKLKIFRKHEY